MRARAGFTLIELIIVMVFGMILLGVAQVNVSRVMNAQTVQRAASTVASDLRLAQTLAGRRRAAVVVAIDTAQRVVRVRNAASDTVYSERHLGNRGDHPLSRVVASNTVMVVYPNGLAAGSLSLQLFASSRSRTVTMSRAGQIRILGS